MYIAGLVIPVPEDRMNDYKDWSRRSADLLVAHGCLEVVESWEDYVPDGKHTDFRRAVCAEPGEKIVFSWQIWPDKASVDAVEKAMASDPRFEPLQDPPFDQGRLIMGCFNPILSTRDRGSA